MQKHNQAYEIGRINVKLTCSLFYPILFYSILFYDIIDSH